MRLDLVAARRNRAPGLVELERADAVHIGLHDHVDGTSFSLAAFGEYLLIDTGYYKPNSLTNSRTADADAHYTPYEFGIHAVRLARVLTSFRC